MSASIESLSSTIRSYLVLKQALGRRFAVERRVLESLDRFVIEANVADLTPAVFDQWCNEQSHVASGVRRQRMQIVRGMCLYRRRFVPDCFVPDPNLFPAPHQVVEPYIFSEMDIVRLLEAATKLPASRRYVLRPQVLRLAIVLLYTTGLRRGELVRLTLADYDPREQTLFIRDTKFHKSRYLPLSADADAEINAYLGVRRAHRLPMRMDSPLLWSGRAKERAFSASSLGAGMRELCRSAGVRKVNGQLPRVHDARHTFACRVLMRWYQAGMDVQAKLPMLATYMGHVSIASTQYYLPFIPELAAEASRRFCSRYGSLVQPRFEEPTS